MVRRVLATPCRYLGVDVRTMEKPAPADARAKTVWYARGDTCRAMSLTANGDVIVFLDHEQQLRQGEINRTRSCSGWRGLGGGEAAAVLTIELVVCRIAVRRRSPFSANDTPNSCRPGGWGSPVGWEIKVAGGGDIRRIHNHCRVAQFFFCSRTAAVPPGIL